MRSAQCASAPSHPFHAMPPRFTRNSDRPRASDRTMVDTEDTRTRLPSFQTRLASSPSADEPHRDGQQARAKTSRSNREALLQTVGWISRKIFSSPVEAELFFLTSLFIELIEKSGRFGSGATRGILFQNPNKPRPFTLLGRSLDRLHQDRCRAWASVWGRWRNHV